MYRNILFIILLLQMFFSCRISAQKPDYRLFQNIGLGTEASVINCFLQDTQGLIWIGSDKGLFSYDGYSTQPHFVFGEHSNTRIYCGAVIDSTFLYLGADNGLLVYNYRTDTYEDLEVDFPTDIRALVMYDGLLWLGTLGGLYTYHPHTRKISSVKEGIPHQTIYSLIHSSDHQLYIGTYNGCCRYTSATGRFETIGLPVNRNKSNQFVNSLLEDTARNCIWIGTEGCLFKYTPADGQIQRIDAFHDNSVKSMALDGYGQLLVGTDNGLYVYRENSPLQHVVHDSRNPQSLSNNIVWAVYADCEQNIWLGTDYGISMARHRETLRYIPISQITGTGEGNQFYSMLRDAHGNFWFGGTNGLIRFTFPVVEGQETEEARNVTWYKMGDRNFPLSHNRVRQLYEDHDGHLWVATDGSISRYDEDSRQFVPYSIVDSTHSYNANWAYGLFEDMEGKLWIATCLGGVFVVDKHKLMHSSTQPYVAEKTYSMQNGLSGMFINQMVSDREGNALALLSTANGIEKINPATHKITHIGVGEFKEGQRPNFVLCAEDGCIWIGFPGGVMRVDSSDGSIKVLAFDTFNHYEVLSMIEADGKIWISTADGFWVADQRTLEVRRLNIADKRFTSLFFDKKEGKLYLGTADGFAVSSPDALLAEHPERPLLLTAFYVNNRPYLPDAELTNRGIRFMEQIQLDYNRNNLVFELSDLPYSLEEKSRIVYRLEGVDDEWILLAPNVNRITYNNLEYGNYRLTASKLDSYGKPFEKIYNLDVTILPPWYYTSWAKAFYILLCCVLIVWIMHFFRVKNRLKLEHLEKERILEQSRAKLEFFINLSHDFKTPLSMIIAPISRMLPEIRNQQEKQQLELVQRNAMKLNSLIHQALDFNRVDSGNSALLILSQIELVSFARDLLALYTEGKTRGKQLAYEFHTNREKIYVQMDAIKLESVLDNLLSNAVKYTPEGGIVTLTLDAPEGGKEVCVSVSDTGTGIPVQDQPYIFQRFFQSSKTAGKNEGTGVGLYLVKTYTELHGGSVNLVSEENAGTTVTLALPVVIQEQIAPVEGADLSSDILLSDAPLILIVDDNAEVADFIYQILHAKYRCRIAKNGKSGLELAMELLPDLVISDVMMPIMDGFEMVRGLKKHVPTSTIPVILLTAKSDKETEIESMQLHVEAFIAKPFEPDILLLRVEQLLASKRTHEAKARMEVFATPKAIEAMSYDEKFLANVTRLIEEHVSDSELNVNTLCDWAATNNKQMYRKLKQLTGMTPVEYIKFIRLKKAAMLLRQKKFTVAEVMYMVGFSNHSYFSKCFQAEFGLTPKQYLAE